MTKKQRAQVVELLRCAADACALNRGHVWFDVVANLIGASDAVVEIAREASIEVMDEPVFRDERFDCSQRGLDVMPNDWNLRVALEAAARVEEGSYP